MQPDKQIPIDVETPDISKGYDIPSGKTFTSRQSEVVENSKHGVLKMLARQAKLGASYRVEVSIGEG